MDKAVIYVRVSSEEQAKHGFSIENQKKVCADFAKKNGYYVDKLFVDEGKSAKNLERPEIQDLMTYCEKKKNDIKAVIIWRLDRISRNTTDYHGVLRPLFERKGIQLLSATEANVSTIEGDLMRNIGMSFAEYERKVIGARTAAGLQQKVRQGGYPHQAPYGYTNETLKDGSKTVVQDENAEYVKRAFEIYSNGDLSLADTAQKLMDEGYYYRPYAQRIPRSVLESILKNIFYTGKFKYKGEVVQGNYEPLISEKLFRQTQRAFRKDGKSLYTKNHFLLGNMLTCDSCGCSIIGEIKKKKYTYYHCSWGHGRDKCENHKYYNETELLKQFDDVVKAITISPQLKAEIKACMLDLNKKEQNYQESNLKRLNATAERLRKEIHMIYQDKLDGVLSQEQWKEENELRQQRLFETKVQIEAFDRENSEFMKEVDTTLELLEHLYDNYLQGSDEERVELLKSLLSNSTLQGGKIDYDYVKGHSV